MDTRHKASFRSAIGSFLSFALALPIGVALSLVSLDSPGAQTITVTDLGLTSGFQDEFFGHHERGRCTIAADFDLDGRVDFYVGNPGEESFVLRNTAGPNGEPVFQIVQVLASGEILWTGAAGDYDNDGDYDLFLAAGGNEDIGLSHLFKNMWMESGQTQLYFVDVTSTAGVAGPVPPGQSSPIPVANAGAVWGDYDRDGDIDLFVSVNTLPVSLPQLYGRNILWRNNGDGTFTDSTQQAGLGTTQEKTRHSTWIDIDNDGDLDLFESNYQGRNVLWQNQLVESGFARYVDVTTAFSAGPNEDLGFPLHAFASSAGDFNNDGWQDLIVFMRDDGPETGSPYAVGHALFMNQSGMGFKNMGDASGLNTPFQHLQGVMGCQIGDINGDGRLDVYIGNGDMFGVTSQNGGQYDQLFLSDNQSGVLPHFTDRSSLIDFPAPVDPAFQGTYPPYPYRTHGVAIADVDNDGILDVAVANGGPAKQPDYMREPNRLFKFDVAPRPNYFKVRPVGDGVNVSRDAMGTRLALTVSAGGGSPWTIYQDLAGSSLFSGQNGFELYFGLKNADTIQSLTIDWPDGTQDVITQGLQPNTKTVVQRTPTAGDIPTSLLMFKTGNQLTLSWAPSCSSNDTDYAVYEGVFGALFQNPSPVACSTGGATSITFTPIPSNAFYLIVPRNIQAEGSYGLRGDGTERPAAQAACAPKQTGACVP